MLSVTFDRTSLGLEPLVITGDPGAGDLHLMENDCGWPTFTMRRTYAPTSENIGGEQLLSAVPAEGQFPLGVRAMGATFADVKAAMDELTAATTQFPSYVLTLVVDGVTIGAYNARPEFPNWAALRSGNVRAKLNEATITIPINPPAGA
jgi:hypothetical protein